MNKLILFILILGLYSSILVGQPSATDWKWTKFDWNPVVKTGNSGEWDGGGAYTPCVLKIDSTYHMWYTGAPEAWNGSRIGYATSTDGLIWNKHPNNPVLVADASWPAEALVLFPVVYYDGEFFHMWYYGFSGGYDGDVGYATSTNGFEWTKSDNNPVLPRGEAGIWDSYGVTPGSVIREDDKYRMWYTATASSGIFELQGTATSEDGANWEKYPDPILELCEGEVRMLSGHVLKSPEGYYYMWYTEGPWGRERLDIRYAYSTDGMQWTQFPGHTVIEKGGENEWDHLLVGFPSVMYDKETDTYKMWYFGSLTDPRNYMIGYAEAPNPITVGNVENKIIPIEYKLSQNYPNPFNPNTTIRYQIASDIRGSTSKVKLLVYDV